MPDWRRDIGTIYGVILNDRASLDRHERTFQMPPYQGLPKAPVLYLKPANTLAREGSEVALPGGAETAEACGALGIVFGATARRASERDALRFVCGYAVVADLTLPHDSLYRPPIREKCFDCSCLIGAELAQPDAVDIASCEVITSVNGMVMQRWALSSLIRPVARLIADVSAFLTLDAGDMLLAGVAAGAPQARHGDVIAVEIPGVGSVDGRIGGALP